MQAELIKRELAIAAELPVDEAGEAALAAKAAAGGAGGSVVLPISEAISCNLHAIG